MTETIHRRPFEVCNIPLFDPANELHREIAKVSAAAVAELLPIIPKMELPVAQARAKVRELVMGKLARLDELTRSLLSAAPISSRRGTLAGNQSELL